jgi:hypothetical protein
MLKLWEESGGPEEDRTPDLFIAKDTTVIIINDLGWCCVAINRGKTGGECTNRAQHSNRPLPVVHSFAATHMNAPAYSRRAGGELNEAEHTV